MYYIDHNLHNFFFFKNVKLFWLLTKLFFKCTVTTVAVSTVRIAYIFISTLNLTVLEYQVYIVTNYYYQQRNHLMQAVMFNTV